jgi:tripartite-type tricarboxylate transporter receptor subunit TctC
VASPQRLASFPNVPTFAEQGIAGFEAYAWQGLVVPKGTDAAFVNQLHAALQEAFKAPAVQQRFASLALEALPGTPQQMADYARAERERWGKLIREKNIRLE